MVQLELSCLINSDIVTINTSAGLTSSMRATALRAWSPSLVAIVVSAGAFAVAFQREISAAIGVWIDSTAYNHCFLILPLVAVLLWMRRSVIAKTRPRPTPWFLLLVPA